jgi:hypothetical protein
MYVIGSAGDPLPAVGMSSDGGKSVTVPDANLLLHGEFKRVGSDLTLNGPDGQRFVVPDYFKFDRLPALLSPDGAVVTGDAVSALLGPLAPGQYAQAGAPTASAAPLIGKVNSVSGTVTVVRIVPVPVEIGAAGAIG